MKKILLLATGGTIASQPTATGLAPRLSPEVFLERMPQLGDICEIEADTLFSLDSSSIRPEHWQRMARRIYRELPHVDGVVLCHGTDTMAYTAAALFSMLPGLHKPVILTGSQLPFEAEHTDAVRNLEDACRVCASGKFPGVYIVFDGEIISGICASKAHTVDFHGFASVNYPSAGTIKNGAIHKNGQFQPPHPVSGTGAQLKDALNPKVICLKLTPGLDGRMLDVVREQGVAGVILEAFGAGGIPCADDSFLEAIDRCAKQGIPVAVTTQCSHGPANLGVYEVGVKAAMAGAICGQSMSREMLAVRLMWALGQMEGAKDAKDMEQIRKMLFQW
ncbi:MAG: asparaginase [Lachnospiraceae bacterium]|nr:asparaginase [Lachnospiraceae bacterium]